MERPQCAPQPIVFGGFEETKNNTDDSDDEKVGEENRIDVEQMTFAPEMNLLNPLDHLKVKRISYFII